MSREQCGEYLLLLLLQFSEEIPWVAALAGVALWAYLLEASGSTIGEEIDIDKAMSGVCNQRNGSACPT